MANEELSFEVIDETLTFIGSLLALIVSFVITLYNALLPLLMFLFVIGMVIVGFLLFDIRRLIKRNNNEKL